MKNVTCPMAVLAAEEEAEAWRLGQGRGGSTDATLARRAAKAERMMEGDEGVKEGVDEMGEKQVMRDEAVAEVAESASSSITTPVSNDVRGPRQARSVSLGTKSHFRATLQPTTPTPEVSSLRGAVVTECSMNGRRPSLSECVCIAQGAESEHAETK